MKKGPEGPFFSLVSSGATRPPCTLQQRPKAATNRFFAAIDQHLRREVFKRIAAQPFGDDVGVRAQQLLELGDEFAWAWHVSV